ncbi:hypothetical protein M5F66_01030, partial [Acinetobacter sp. ANC 5033]|nr:hypothetical protein [Acinetobacter amyesii]
SKEAVNGSQLYNAQSNVKNILGSSTTVDAAGNLTSSNIGDVAGANTVHDAIKQVNATANAGWNVTGSSANSANIGPNGKLDVKGSNNNLTVSQTG